MKTKLIIFDCDGVLVDSEKISSQVFAQLMNELGIEISAEQVYKDLVGGSMRKSIDYVEAKLGRTLPEEAFTEKYRQRSFDAYHTDLKAVRGVKKLIQSLPINYCVGSNGPLDKIKLNLKLTGLQPYFAQHTIFSAYMLNKWKPDPSLFLHAASMMQVAPEHTLVIEDSINGIMAANKAGMRSLAYCPGEEDRFGEVAATCIQSMDEVLDYLEG